MSSTEKPLNAFESLSIAVSLVAFSGLHRTAAQAPARLGFINTDPPPGRNSSVVGDDRDNPAGGATAADEPQREAADHEALRGKPAEIDQPLDLGVGEAGLVRGPEHALLPPALRLLGLQMERRIPAPGVDPHHPNTLLVEPAGRLRGDTGTARDVVRLAIERVPAAVHEDDVPWLERPRQALLEVLCAERLAVLAVGRVNHDAGRVEPVERQLVDRLRPLAPDH